MEAKLGGVLLGIHWKAKEDLMAVEFWVNLGLSRKGFCLEPDLNQDTVEEGLASYKLTRGLCLRLVVITMIKCHV